VSLTDSLLLQLYIVPVTIDYEKPLEVMLHQNELLGEGKVKESIGALLKSWHVTRQNFGSISVQFADPLSVKDYAHAMAQGEELSPDFAPEQRQTLVRELAYDITDAMTAASTCTTSHLVATLLLLYREGISKAELVNQTKWLRLEILRRGGRVTGTQGRSPAVIVDNALDLLKDLVVRRRKDLVEPAITSVRVYPYSWKCVGVSMLTCI
jgi:glycerol-3-phosphate O-acyltransferase